MAKAFDFTPQRKPPGDEDDRHSMISVLWLGSNYLKRFFPNRGKYWITEDICPKERVKWFNQTMIPYVWSGPMQNHQDARAPSRCPSEDLGPSYVVAYPHESKPILVDLETPWHCAYLDENPDQDYELNYNKKKQKSSVSSPSLGQSKYVPVLNLW